MKILKSWKTLTLVGAMFGLTIQAQLPSKVLVGYWHNWEALRIKDLDDRYNVICLSFLEADKDYPAQPDNNVVGDLEFTPYNNTQLKADIPVVQAQGKKVIISIGGANGSFKLNNATDKNTFVTKVKDFIQTYGVDGIDIDLERQVYTCATGGSSTVKIASPTDPHIVNLIAGIKEIMSWYQTTYSKKLILTMAPETIYIQGALSNWAVNNACGGHYLAIIEQLRDEIDLMMIQLYNSGGVLDLNNVERFQGTPEFVTSNTESLIRGFNAKAGIGSFSGLPASKVVVALPACNGSGYIAPTNLKAAMKYLIGEGPKAGAYTLKENGGYPTLRGMMTWSANNDKGCGYEFAQVFEDVFGEIDNNTEAINTIEYHNLALFPNPAETQFQINSENLINQNVEIFDYNGKLVSTQIIKEKKTTIDVSQFSKGFYTVKAGKFTGKLIVK